MEWSDLSAPYCKAFEAAFVYKPAAWGAEGMVVLENAAGARVFEVAFIYAFGDIFFAVGSYAVVGGGWCKTEGCLGDIALSNL